MRFSLKSIFVLITLIALVLAFYNHYRSRFVLYRKATDGTEFVLYQIALGDGPFSFDTRFYYKDTKGVWKGYYYDHEDPDPWTDCRAEIDEENKSIVIYRAGNPDIRLNWVSGVYERYFDGSFMVVYTSAFEARPKELSTTMKEEYLQRKKQLR